MCIRDRSHLDCQDVMIKTRRDDATRWLLADHQTRRLIVLLADELDQLGVELAVGHQSMMDTDCERTRVRLRIVDGDVDLDRAVVQPTPPFGHLRSVSQWTAVDVEPPAIAKAAGLHDERVAVPSSD